MPETYIPWQLEPEPGDIFLPEMLTSLQGLDIYDTLTPAQKLETGPVMNCTGNCIIRLGRVPVLRIYDETSYHSNLLIMWNTSFY